MSTEPPTGQRFSHVYLDRRVPAQDSIRMRRRLAQLIWDIKDLKNFSDMVPGEMGVDVPYPNNWSSFFKTCELQDVLDIVTVAYGYLAKKERGLMYDTHAAERWRDEVQRIFTEENVHYRVDKMGGVHFRFDKEFANNQAATIAALQTPRYRNVVAEFESAMSHLGKAPPDGKAAIRNTFSAAEGLFKLMFQNSPRLASAEAQKLEALIQTAYATNSVALSAAIKLLNGFRDWIDAAHFYRHEAGHEEPTQPPLTLTIQMVSVGAAFIRWLAELDSLSQKKKQNDGR